MRAVYINLDRAKERRAEIEASFARVPHAGWTLERLPAATAAEMVTTPGSLSPAQKGCFESHRRLLASALDDEAPLFVLEDDTAFSALTFPVIGELLRRPADWDILFTDVNIADGGFALQLAARRDDMVQARQFVATPLTGRKFSASGAYVVRGASKRRLHALITEADALDTPYDLFLRELCDGGRLKVGACFPFVTMPTAQAERSQILTEEIDAAHQALTAFRRLMFVERDLEACRRADAALRAQCSEVQLMVGTILSTLVF
jgi:GR25 family glycosyltransferase involved in LPS biosynthesis